MSLQITAAARPTFYFIGVSTGSSSIMKVFPAWAEHLGLDAVIRGIDLALDDTPENYRAVVDFLKKDPLSLGSLVTTHKLNLYKAASDLFDRVGSDTELLDEVSSISKHGPELWGNAMDPITCGLSLEAIVDDGYWARTGGELLLLGAGGSSLALTLYLHRRAVAGQDVPSKVVVTNRRPQRLAEMQAVHERLGIALPVEYHLSPTPDLNDARFLSALAVLDVSHASVAQVFDQDGFDTYVEMVLAHDPARVAILRRALQAVNVRFNARGVSTTPAHGDYGPWNTLRLADGGLFGRGFLCGPPGEPVS